MALEKSKEREINLKELYFVIKKRLWIVVVITVITTLLGAFYSKSNNTPIYQSSSRIIIDAQADYRNTLQVIIKDSTILDVVVKQLGLEQTAESLAGKITVSSIENSQVVSIAVTDTDPTRAALIANTVARVFKEKIPTILDFKKVTLLSDAKVNPWPINQNQNKMVIIGIIAGLIVGIGMAFLLDSLDDTFRSNRDIEIILGLPTLGIVSKVGRKNLKKKNAKHVVNVRGETIGFK